MKTLSKGIALLLCLCCFSTQAQTSFWGTIIKADSNNASSIFKINSDGTGLRNVFSFPFSYPGRKPYNVLVEKNGKLYGSTANGGDFNRGVSYEYDPITQDYRVFHHNSKADPHGKIYGYFEGPDHRLYATSTSGQSSNAGVIIAYDPNTDSLKVIHNFSSIKPLQGVVLGPDTKLYGYGTNANNDRILYRYDVFSNTLETLHTFSNGPEGKRIIGRLMIASDSMLYGYTSDGGTRDEGCIFRFDLQSTMDVVNSFNRFDSVGNAVFNSFSEFNGKLYGATRQGGAANRGVIFSFDIASETINVRFVQTLATLRSITDPFLVHNDQLYGFAQQGSSTDANNGALFVFDPMTNTLSEKVAFDSLNFEGANAKPLLFNGKIFGPCNKRGNANQGGMLEYDLSSASGKESFSFSQSPLGYEALKMLTYSASHQMIYGQTRYGGANGFGVVFAFDPVNETYEKLYDFDKTVGYDPSERWVEASNGKLYTTTLFYSLLGPTTQLAQTTLFELDPIAKQVRPILTTDFNDGYSLYGSLTATPDNKLLGICERGGSTGQGSILRFDPVDSTYEVTANFSGDDFWGGRQITTFLAASDGNYYAIRPSFLNLNYAVLFEYNDTTGAINVRHRFPNANNSTFFDMEEADPGQFYFVDYYSSGQHQGQFFRYDANLDSMEILQTLADTSDIRPFGQPISGPNGALYCLAYDRSNDPQSGYLLRKDPLSNQFVPLSTLNFPYGGTLESDLIAVPISTAAQNDKLPQLVIYPNPTSGIIQVQWDDASASPYRAVIFDINGAQIWQGSDSSSQTPSFQIDLTHYPTGLYHLIIHTEKGVLNHKIIKQ